MTALPWSAARPGRLREIVAEAGRGSARSEKEVVISSGLLVISLILFWLVAQILLLGGLEQERAQDRLYGEFRAQLATGEAPTGGIIAPGRPVAMIEIPNLGLSEVVVEGTSPGHLMSGPGHRRDTVLPGQAGVSVLFGKSRSFGAPFKDVVNEGIGQTMLVTTAQGRSTYRIEQIRRAGDDLPAPPASGGGRITMITSLGSGTFGALDRGEVVYVDASLSSKAYQGGGVRINAIAASEQKMASDTSVLPMLALTLGALLVTVVAAPFTVRRFGPVLSWTVLLPVLLALSWFAADLTVYLLPNLV